MLALMILARQKGLLEGAKICWNAPPISNLMFADDCILFGEAMEKGINVIKNILCEYEVFSSQCVNFEKIHYFL